MSTLLEQIFQISNLDNVSIQDSSMIFAKFEQTKLNNAKIINSALSHSFFSGAHLNQTTFTHSGLEDADFTHSIITFSTKFCDCKVNDMIIEKSRLESMNNYGGLSVGHRMRMNIIDHVAVLRASYSGFQQWIHIIALCIFAFPYAWFIIKHWIHAQFLPTGSGSSVTLAEALARYIYNGGVAWQDGYQFHWTFITFVWMFTYNVMRSVLLWKTKTLELQQNISGLPVLFTLPGSGWGLMLKITNWSFLITMIIVLFNTGHFFMMRVAI